MQVNRINYNLGLIAGVKGKNAAFRGQVTNPQIQRVASLGADTFTHSAKKNLKTISDLGNITGKVGLVRVDFNVPMINGVITDDTRIKSAMKTILTLKEGGAKVVLMSHKGRPKGEVVPSESLKPIAEHLSKLLGEEVLFIPSVEKAPEYISKLKNGQVGMLENIRFYKEEEAKDNDMTFANKLASLGDFYVNDAFGAAHRNHASTSKIAKTGIPVAAGFLMEKEITNLSNALENPERPFTAIVGGSKVSSKIGLINNILDKMHAGDNIIIGGGMGYTFSAAEGGKTGNSRVEKDFIPVAQEAAAKAKSKGVNFYTPIDVIYTNDFNNGVVSGIADIHDIPDGYEGVDEGFKTRELFSNVINNSKTVLMNGPVGVFEIENFAGGTKAVLDAITKMTKKGGTSVIGGGDSVSAVNQYSNPKNFSHVSTGGGASLEFIEGKDLPGVSSLYTLA